MSTAWRRWQNPLWLLLTALLLWWAGTGLQTHSINLRESVPQTIRIFHVMFAEMDWAYRGELAVKLLETVQMAILGTFLAALLAVPFGFLAARTVARQLSGVGKLLLNVIRVFPEIILAIVFIKGVGPGPLSGVLAMGIHSIGMLGKLYAESVESVDRGPTEALLSTGANKVQQLWFAVMPQVLPEFASYAIYRFEINARAAAVLGVVGAGGIGAPLIFAIQQRVWGRVGVILLGIIVVVSAIDLLSASLRKRLV